MPSTYGELLKDWRNRSHLTQQELSERAGCSSSYIAHIESQLKSPSLDLALAIANVLNLNPEEQNQFFDAIDSASRQRTEQRRTTRGLALRGLLRGRKATTKQAQEATSESEDIDAEDVVRDFENDRDLQVAYQHLKACFASANPEIKTTIQNLLRTFAEKAHE